MSWLQEMIRSSSLVRDEHRQAYNSDAAEAADAAASISLLDMF